MSIDALVRLGGGHFDVGSHPLASIEAADIRFFNAQSIVCRLLETGEISEETSTKWLEMAAGPRLIAEAVASQADPAALKGRTTMRDLLLKNGAPGDHRLLALFSDSIEAAARTDPVGAMNQALLIQQGLDAVLNEAAARILAIRDDRELMRIALANLTSDVRRIESGLERMERSAASSDSAVGSIAATSLARVNAVAGLQFLTPIDSAEILFPVSMDRAAENAVAPILNRVAQYRKLPYTFSIVGQSDPSGGQRMNLRLSERRAEFVRRLLVERGGIPPSRIAILGIGESTQPSVPIDNYPAQRRVLVIVHGPPP